MTQHPNDDYPSNGRDWQTIKSPNMYQAFFPQYWVKRLRKSHWSSVEGHCGFCLRFSSTVLCPFLPTAKLAERPGSTLPLDWLATKDVQLS